MLSLLRSDRQIASLSRRYTSFLGAVHMFRWLVANREWIFSGVGVAVIGSFVGWLVHRDRAIRSNQTQHGGVDSLNLQAGRDITVNKNDLHRR